jgi:hypothetical protein
MEKQGSTNGRGGSGRTVRTARTKASVVSGSKGAREVATCPSSGVRTVIHSGIGSEGYRSELACDPINMFNMESLSGHRLAHPWMSR